MAIPCVSRLIEQQLEGKIKRHLFATLPIFPMLIPQSSEPSLFSDHPLVFLERLTNCASSNLCVFIVPVNFVFTIRTSQQVRKGTVREELTPGRGRHCCCLLVKVEDSCWHGTGNWGGLGPWLIE